MSKSANIKIVDTDGNVIYNDAQQSSDVLKAPPQNKENVASAPIVANDTQVGVLRGIDLNVEKGEVVGFVGSNGAGKSTLLKIVAGVMKPTKGKVLVGGNICPMIELGAGFDLDLNARENIYLNGAVMGYSKSFLDSKFQEIVDFSELHDFLDVPVRNFSSGMVARLAFSVATVVDPEILIVDEILSVGDLNFQNKSENKMRSLISGGTTVLYVSHSIKSIQSLCDRVVWLEHGKVVMVGKTDEVCKAYYESQMDK